MKTFKYWFPLLLVAISCGIVCLINGGRIFEVKWYQWIILFTCNYALAFVIVRDTGIEKDIIKLKRALKELKN